MGENKCGGGIKQGKRFQWVKRGNLKGIKEGKRMKVKKGNMGENKI